MENEQDEVYPEDDDSNDEPQPPRTAEEEQFYKDAIGGKKIIEQ